MLITDAYSVIPSCACVFPILFLPIVYRLLISSVIKYSEAIPSSILFWCHHFENPSRQRIIFQYSQELKRALIAVPLKFKCLSKPQPFQGYIEIYFDPFGVSRTRDSSKSPGQSESLFFLQGQILRLSKPKSHIDTWLGKSIRLRIGH